MTEFNPIYLTEEEHTALDHTGVPGVQNGASVDLSAYEGEDISLSAVESLNLIAGEGGIAIASDPASIFAGVTADNGTVTISASGTGGTVGITAGAVNIEGTGDGVEIAASSAGSGVSILANADDGVVVLHAGGTAGEIRIGGTNGIGFNGAVASIPEIPASPTAAQIAAVLVALGLATQGA